MSRAPQTVGFSNGTSQSRYLWLVFGAILLALVILWPLLGRRLAPLAQGAAGQSAAAQQAGSVSLADAARRAFIASLGPMKRHKGINAADFYKQAAGLYWQLTDAERDMFNGSPKHQDPKAAAALYAKIQPIMDLIRKGRTGDYSDWGMAPGTLYTWTGPDLTPPIGDLGSLGNWEAAYRFQTGDANGAIGDLAATEAMARNGIDDYTWYVNVFQIHDQALSVLAQNAPSLGGISSSADLQYILDPSAPRQDLQQALASFESILQSYAGGSTNPKPPGDDLFLQHSEPGSFTPQQEAVQIQWLANVSNMLLSTLGQPDAQFEQAWKQEVASAPSPSAINFFVTSGQFLHYSAQIEDTTNAMFAAGLALEQGDQSQYESITDPATGQPFIYTQTPSGFQLQTAPPNKVKLEFSTPAANGGN